MSYIHVDVYIELKPRLVVQLFVDEFYNQYDRNVSEITQKN